MTGKLQTIGTRAQVWHGTAKKTSGGLIKSNLMMNKHGRIVSRSKHNTAKKENRLLKHGFGTKKGKFGFVKVDSRKRGKGSKKMRGGSLLGDLSPARADSSYMISGVVPQKMSPIDRALTGGRRKKHMKGGYDLQPADVSAADITGYAGKNVIGLTDYPGAGSTSLQLEAGQTGGKRRRRSQKGGTGSKTFGPGSVPLKFNSPLSASLQA